MKVKTSITMSDKLLRIVDQRSRRSETNRSSFIEAAVAEYIRQELRRERDARDLEIINRNADRLNKEAADALTYQIPL